MEQSAEEEINRLKETLAASSHEMEQIKEDFTDRANKLQYAEQLLEKAKADFREKNSRIKALETHLDESRKKDQPPNMTARLLQRGILKFSRGTQAR